MLSDKDPSGQIPSLRSLHSVSSLVEAGAVHDLRELPKQVHGIHRVFCRPPLFQLLRDIRSRVRDLIQAADPGEELSQSRHASVPALLPLPRGSQTEQGPVCDRGVDAVAVRQDLLSEGAGVPAVGGLRNIRSHVNHKVLNDNTECSMTLFAWF